MIIALLGRQPKIGIAELESICGADALQPLGDHAALLHVESVDPERLGGTIKLAKPLIELSTTAWPKLIDYVAKALPEHVGYIPEGKIKLAIGTYGLTINAQQLFRAGLELKKICRAAGRSVRIVPPQQNATAPNSAQTLHNQLTGPLGMELLLIKNGTSTWLAQTTWVQDIDDYARRDYGRPKRDAFVGMLPPKLAQQMLHLAQVESGQTVLDPFCGTGVVLQEAALAGCNAYGSDVQQKMIDFTHENLEWLAKQYNLNIQQKLEAADATNHKWKAPLDHVVCETYLGQPLSGLPSPAKLNDIISTCDTITKKFLRNLRPQLAPGSRHCLAVPAWRVGNNFRHLSTLDHLEDLGYNHVRFQHANAQNDLIYHREDQIVARELLVITVK